VKSAIYSDQILLWLKQLGYTHCFYLAGGNIMHLLHSAKQSMICIPVAHEVTAGIAAEYFNELSGETGKRAFALVTAGPGLTNIVTALAGAYMESRDLLVIGGQVKTSDLSNGKLRQRGIQEIDGPALVRSTTKSSITLVEQLSEEKFKNMVINGFTPRKGPVFIEIPLDVQAKEPVAQIDNQIFTSRNELEPQKNNQEVIQKFLNAKRPVLLLGGGLSRDYCEEVYSDLLALEIPIMTTWNGADRIGADEDLYWGRPNTWGQRYSNVLIQQSDFIVALGTRLGLQQTGFNWQEFGSQAEILQIDLDNEELSKGHPKITYGICMDANIFLEELLKVAKLTEYNHDDWINYGKTVKGSLPLSEASNKDETGLINPYDFVIELSQHLKSSDVVVPSSSGSSMTVTMQSLLQPKGCKVVTNKSLASMGYGLGGAIGASFSTSGRVIHIEGDGGFLQNIQDLGTLRKQKLPIKTFILDNGGYASIRMTQLNYFNGDYMGCDETTGLGLPDWELLARAFGINFLRLDPNNIFTDEVLTRLESDLPEFFVVPISQEQTYFPKISSHITETGGMESNPLHLMTPEITLEESLKVMRYINATEAN
jgi:acetolactate synthase-1/2/3 large subunit